MIQLLKSGNYRLVETKHCVKILYIDDASYVWVSPPHIGEILVTTHKDHKTDCTLSRGRYNLYSVDDEPHFSDQIHLELDTGNNSWQGYLLLSGLPNDEKIRGRIIPTSETITGHARLSSSRKRSVAL